MGLAPLAYIPQRSWLQQQQICSPSQHKTQSDNVGHIGARLALTAGRLKLFAALVSVIPSIVDFLYFTVFGVLANQFQLHFKSPETQRMMLSTPQYNKETLIFTGA